jgi:hypothetical protein
MAIEHTIFGSSAYPGTLTLFTDGTPNIVVSNGFYTYTSGADGWYCVGARVYIPASITQTNPISVGMWLYAGGGNGPDLTVAPVREGTISSPATGWNEVRWDHIEVVPGTPFWIGYDLGEGRYMYASDVTNDFIQASDSATVVLGENNIAGLGLRKYFRIGDGGTSGSSGAGAYGIDVIIDEEFEEPIDPIAYLGEIPITKMYLGVNEITGFQKPSSFPDEFNTGIAQFEGLELTPYTGSGTFSTTVEYDARSFLANNMSNEYIRIDNNGHFKATRSYFDCRIDCDGANRSLELEDCTVDAMGEHLGVGYNNLTLTRCNISNALQCVNTSSNVYIDRCYIHNPFLPNTEDHINPFFNGGGELIEIRNSTFWAPQEDNVLGGGVTTNLSFFPDMGPVRKVTIDGCYFRYTGGAYGITLGWNPGKPFNDDPLNATEISVTNCVFEKRPGGDYTGYSGTVTGWNGGTWTNNVYTDGTTVTPA